MPSNAANKIAQRDFEDLLETARSLQRAAASSLMEPLLRGHRFGLMRGTGPHFDEATMAFDRAATDLGGQLTLLQTDFTELGDVRVAERTAKMLGRLYSAILCESVDPDIVARLRSGCAIPIHADVTAPSHVVRKVSDLLGCPHGAPWFALQALLLKSTR